MSDFIQFARSLRQKVGDKKLGGDGLRAQVAWNIILKSSVAGLKMAHILEITAAFEFAVLTLTVLGLRLRKYHNPLCFRVSAPFSSSLTAEFSMIYLRFVFCYVLTAPLMWKLFSLLHRVL